MNVTGYFPMEGVAMNQLAVCRYFETWPHSDGPAKWQDERQASAGRAGHPFSSISNL
jgi:hypothetical protein